MKTLLVMGLSALILSTDVEASLGHPGQEVQQDIPIPVQASPWGAGDQDPANIDPLARIYLDFGIHAPIGRHGRIDLYFGGPGYGYGYPSHYRYRHHYKRYNRHHYRPHYRPHFRNHYRPHRSYPHRWKRHHNRGYDHNRHHPGPRQHRQWR